MDNTAITFMYGFLHNIWRLFTSWEFPYLGFTPAQLYFFILVAPLAVRIVKSIISLSIENMTASGEKRGGKKS